MMIATPNYHPTSLYADRELYTAIMTYLKNNFVFRKLEIDQWLGVERIVFKHRDNFDPSLFDNGKSTEEIWYDGDLDNWHTVTPIMVKNICSEFTFKNGAVIGKGKKKLISDIIKVEINHGAFIETIKFNPILKKLVDGGRKKVKDMKPLHYASNKRVNVELNEGDLCYFCWNTRNPYVANPAYVFRKTSGSYIIIFFTNQSKGSETSKLEINIGRFINAPANELGLTPEQAVLQRFC